MTTGRGKDDMEERDRMDRDGPVKYPVDGTLDLHMFDPSDAKEVVIEYLSECRKKGILEVRIVHGKGTGALRERVHATLSRTGSVAGFRLAGAGGGSWGATLVSLKPPEEDPAT